MPISALGFLGDIIKITVKVRKIQLQIMFDETFCSHWQRIKNRSEGLFCKKKFVFENNPEATKKIKN
jgi:hypothetical protein